MNITLEMVDEVINRTGVSYKVAKEALELSDGDIVKALIYIEETQEFNDKKSTGKRMSGEEIVAALKSLANEGLINKIVIEKNGTKYIDLPVAAGAVGIVAFPLAITAGIVASVATGCHIKIFKKDGGILDINEMTQEKFNEVKQKLRRESAENAEDCCKEDEEAPYTEESSDSDAEADLKMTEEEEMKEWFNE